MSTTRFLLGIAAATLPGLMLPVAVADDRPNIVLIMVDDMGYSDIGCYGGEIETPHLDRLAANGLRFTQFYNSARCCPTRASLLTGLHPHQTGIGYMTNNAERPTARDRQVPGYRGELNRACVTIAEALRPAGYQTLMTGKWHLGYHKRENWPLQRGFDRYYGIISGASNFFHPKPPRGLTLGNEHIEPESTTDRRYYTTDAFTDYAIKFVREAQRDQPFFLYLAYTAPHWPLHAHDEEINRYRGKYMLGWDKLRQQRLARMQQMGIIKAEWPLVERDARAWSKVKPKKRDELDLRMAIYAAMIDRMDQNVGKLVAILEQLGELDNTLILFLSDNGGCAEGGELGHANVMDREKREAGYFLTYGRAWANASNTPFRKYKHYTHEGGIATPLIAHWPKGVTARGELYHAPAYLPDIMPTLLELAQAEYPKTHGGHDIHPLSGISLRPAFEQRPLQRKEPMFWEHEGNRAIRIGDWKLVSTGDQKFYSGEQSWELYNLARDRTERHDLATEQPERVADMRAQWWQWARENHVVPNGLDVAPARHDPRPAAFRDPHYGGSADPEIIWNPHAKEWLIFYTGRRTGVDRTPVHCPIGVAASKDGWNWEFRGYCKFDGVGGKKDSPDHNYWAPGVVRVDDTLHMFVTFASENAGFWGGGDQGIMHYTTPISDPINGWKRVGWVAPTKNNKIIDAGLARIGDEWRMWTKNRVKTGLFRSTDLKTWTDAGLLTDQPQNEHHNVEGPYVFRWLNAWWMVTDPHNGIQVYRSADAMEWKHVGTILLEGGQRELDQTRGRHPSVAVVNDRAFIVYHVEPYRDYPTPLRKMPPGRRVCVIQIAELKYDAATGKITCDRNTPARLPIPSAHPQH